MKCRECQSDDLVIIQSGPHSKLVCGECWEFQRFIPKNIAKNFKEMKASQINNVLDNIPEGGKQDMEYLGEISFKLDLILDHLGIIAK